MNTTHDKSQCIFFYSWMHFISVETSVGNHVTSTHLNMYVM